MPQVDRSSSMRPADVFSDKDRESKKKATTLLSRCLYVNRIHVATSWSLYHFFLTKVIMVKGTDILQLTTPPVSPLSARPCCSNGTQDIGMTAKDSRMSAVMANSIYTTFRMAQLINSFRNRVKTRLLSHTATTKASDASTQDDLHDEWEDEVLDVMSDGQIQRQLVKRRGSCVKNLENNSHSYTTANDSRLGQGGSRVTDLHVAYGLLAKLDCRLFPGTSLADLAVDSTFMSQWYNIDFNGGVKKVAELLALTNGLLSVLKLSGAQDTTNQSTHFGDAIFAANLEHLLLCVQNDLLRFLLNEAWPKILDHIFECQREQSRRCEAWFFEYPDARHPLSTTWPWSIRPSLAVLWGVCWKFLDNYDYQWDDQGNLLMPSGEVLLWAHDLLGYDGPEASYGECTALLFVFLGHSLYEEWSLLLPPRIDAEQRQFLAQSFASGVAVFPCNFSGCI